MNKNDIDQQLLSVTRDFLTELQAERALQAITLNASLERELGIDSLGKVELFHRIEKKFAIHLPENAIVDAETLQDLVKLIDRASPETTLTQNPQTHSPILESTTVDLSQITHVGEALLKHAEANPDRPHIYLQDEQGHEQIIRYGQLADEARAIANGLQQRGIRPGETIAIMLPTCDAFFYAYSGVLLAGAVPVPIYPPLRPDRIEEYAKREAKILHNAEVRLLITFSRAEILSHMLRTFIPSLKEVVTVANLKGSKKDFTPVTIETNDPALIQYTSGSTGDPKGVFLTHENMLSNMRAIGEAVPVKRTDIEVSWLPLYHDMGLMSWLASLYFGIPLTLLSPLTFLARPERWLWAIHYHRATLSGGPNFAYELCVKKINPKDIEGLDLSSWRFAFSGAEAINPRTLERFHKKFAPYGFKLEMFAPVYGLAESTVALTFPPTTRAPRIDKIEREAFEKENKAVPTHSNDKKKTLEFVACGVAMNKHAIRIADDKNYPLAERQVGNIQFQGPSAMQGYFNNPAATQQIYHDGWWTSGDLGYLADNEIFIVGRKKDMIIKAGRNLYPEEVEEVVSQIASVRNGCVVAFGITDSVSGTEKLIVVAETYDLSKEKQQDIRTEIIEKLAISLGIPPDTVVLVPPRTIPKTSSGKLQRSACKQAFIKGKLSHSRLPAKLQIAKLGMIVSAKKSYGWLKLLGKSLYTFYAALISFFIFSLAWLSVMILPHKTAARAMRFFARNLFRLIGCPIAIVGRSNLKNDSPMIYVVNHASYIDSLLLIGILPVGVTFIGKKELLKTPILRTFFNKLGFITVDRMDFVKSLQNKDSIENAVKQGQSIVIFPEGTFTYATGLRPFKLGAFTIANDTQTPICPVAIHGTRMILRGTDKLGKPGPIKVTIGKPIYPKQKDWNEIIRLHSLTRIQIAKHCGEPVIDVIAAGPVVERE